MSLVFWLLFLVAVGVVGCQTIASDDEESETVVIAVDAVLGKSATLPCDIEPGVKETRADLVLWFRDQSSKPIYNFDVRGRALSKAPHWSDPEVFGPRAYFVTVSRPAALTLDGVQLNDEGIYRCRVDFRSFPSRNIAINLTVIVPPHQLLLYDNSGRDVNTTVGPLEEGSDLVLTCEVRGGRPPPSLIWFVDDKLTEGKMEAIGNHVMVNRLEVPNLHRDHLNSTFKCQASNTKLMLPLEKTVRLEMLLRPLSVLITHKPHQMVANREYVIKCQVDGSRPRPTVTWTRENRIFRRGKITEEESENTLISSVTFAPVPEDDGTILKCIGDNPNLVAASQEDSFKLNVVYPPQVELQLGTSLNPDDIKEGDDVYFECNIKANPKEYKITWFHNGVPVSHNVSKGIIISAHSLVLQSVSKTQSGSYSCAAANARGEGSSTTVDLRVRFPPVCKDQEVTVIGASIDEILKVRCQVSADPGEVTFIWQFNNSGESFDVSPARFATSSGNVSELMYTPTNQRDYGTLTCWGKNTIGRQQEPCVFQVVPATKPGTPTNCTLRGSENRSSEILEVECRPGYDGGLPQIFRLEAYDANNMKLRLNLSSLSMEVPLFRLDLSDLPPLNGAQPALRLAIFAINSKGRGEQVVLEDIMLNDAEKRTDGGTNISILPLAALLTGSLLTLGLGVLVCVVLTVRKRHRHCGGSHCALQLDPKQPKPPMPGSMLEINTGDNRYVVAYTVKTNPDCNMGAQLTVCTPVSMQQHHDLQPDILNTPRGGDTTTPTSASGQISRPDALFPNPGDRLNSLSSFNSYQKQNAESGNAETCATLGRNKLRPKDMSFSTFATMRRDHIIADSIPGPESCV